MDRATIVKDLRARGWHGYISKQVAIDRGYTISHDYEWVNPEPAMTPSTPAAPKMVALVSAEPKPVIPAKPAATPAKVVEPAK